MTKEIIASSATFQVVVQKYMFPFSLLLRSIAILTWVFNTLAVLPTVWSYSMAIKFNPSRGCRPVENPFTFINVRNVMSGLNGRQFVDKYFKFIIFYGNCDSNITEDCSWDPFSNKTTLFRIMAWYLTGKKLLYDSFLPVRYQAIIRKSETYMHHSVLVRIKRGS